MEKQECFSVLNMRHSDSGEVSSLYTLRKPYSQRMALFDYLDISMGNQNEITNS